MPEVTVSWSRPGPQNLYAAAAFYRTPNGEGRHAFLYRQGDQVIVRTRDAAMTRVLAVDRRPDLKSAKRLVERRAARRCSP